MSSVDGTYPPWRGSPSPLSMVLPGRQELQFCWEVPILAPIGLVCAVGFAGERLLFRALA